MIAEAKKLPFYPSVPKGMYENLQYRREVLIQCLTNIEARKEYWIACKRDLLFYINVFGWTYDPIILENPAVPFITYEYQDDALLEIQAALGSHDIFQEKSRDMGATWISELPMVHRWHFFELQSFLFGSRKEEYVDKTGDPKTLFWKVDFFLGRLPKWLQPNYTRTYMHIVNDDNGSTIDGESTNADFGRGDRRTAILLDEFASCNNGSEITSATRDTSPCRIFNSTPKGINNEFYRIKKRGKCKVLRFHWTLHPIKAAGLYYDAKGNARSPWYDRECERASHPQEIAQELDIDYSGSESQFFDAKIVAQLQEKTKPALYVGEIAYEPESHRPTGFIQRKGGRLSLWRPMRDGRLNESRYALGIDVAVGTAGPESSNSVISIGDLDSREKIGEFVTRNLTPDELASMALVIARWLAADQQKDIGEYIIWEANGPGREFGMTLVDKLHFYNVYYRRREDTVSKKAGDFPGWWSSKESKMALLGEYRRALSSDEFSNPSYDALEQCNQYIFMPNGSVIHSLARAKDNAAGHGEHHGDHVIADALLNRAFCTSSAGQMIEQKKDEGPAENTFQFRRDLWERKNKQKPQSRWAHRRKVVA